MTIALAHVLAAPAFNTAFYSVTATVIPVLFLAIAVQGRLYEDLVKAGVEAYKRNNPPARLLPSLGWLLMKVVVSSVLLFTVAAILMAGRHP